MTPEQFRIAMEGVTAIAITPMKDGGEIDLDGVRTHLRFLLANGVKAPNAVLVLTGSTGESGALTPQERYSVWETALDEVGDQLPLVAGINHSDIGEARAMATKASELNMAGVMAVSPYYYAPTSNVSVEWYKQLADASDRGIMLYNNLEVTRFDIPVSTLVEIAEQVPEVVGLKECTPSFPKMERVVRELGDRLTVINGHGEFLEPYAAVAGTAGFISSTSNFAPGIAMEMWELRSQGKYAEAHALRKKLSPYLDLAADLGAAGGEPKVLQLLKHLAGAVAGLPIASRLPLLPLSDEEATRAQSMLKTIGLA